MYFTTIKHYGGKMFKKAFILLLGITSLLLTTSCVRSIKSEIVGTWEGTEPYSGKFSQYTFGRDGTFECYFFDEDKTISGTYHISDENELFLKDYHGNSQAWSIEDLDDGMLYLNSGWGLSMILEKVD
jgi:hypothetical protein